MSENPFKNLRETVDREALMELYNRRVWERLTVVSNQVTEALKQDPNQAIYDLVYQHTSQDGRVYVEDMELYLKANVLDANRQVVNSVDIWTDPQDTTKESVTLETYDILKTLSVDPEIIKLEIASQLEDKAV